MNDIVCHKTFSVMGGEFQFSCFPQNFLSKSDVYSLFDDAFNEVKRIEEKFTDFKESYFSRINESAGKNPVSVDDETLFLLNESNRISDLSKGVFDISFASVGHLWRSEKEKGRTLDSALIKSRLEHINYKLIQIDNIKKTVFLPHADMKIGLGGIGKGYAVDQVYRLFKERGLYNFYINGAGDIRVNSRVDAPRKWRIGIRNPLSSDASKSVGVIQMDSGSIASSGGYIHNVNGDTGDHHIIDPFTGRSKNEIISSTVIADDALTADTTATILMNLTVPDALAYMNDSKLTGLVFNKSGTSFLSERALKNFGLPVVSRI